jgi:hypothetical protein
MIQPFSLNIGVLRFLCGLKNAKLFADPVRANARFVSVYSFGYAQSARFISFVRRHLVLDIFGRRHIPQVFQSVVVRPAVYMVDVVFRPFSVRVQPNKPVRPVPAASYWHDAVPKVVDRPRDTAYSYPAVGFYLPAQKAGFKITVKKFFESVARKHGRSSLVFSCLAAARASTVKTP